MTKEEKKVIKKMAKLGPLASKAAQETRDKILKGECLDK